MSRICQIFKIILSHKLKFTYVPDLNLFNFINFFKTNYGKN